MIPRFFEKIRPFLSGIPLRLLAIMVDIARVDVAYRQDKKNVRCAELMINHSALADFCEHYPAGEAPFTVCGLNLRLHEAALRWLDEGAGSDCYALLCRAVPRSALVVETAHPWKQRTEAPLSRLIGG